MEFPFLYFLTFVFADTQVKNGIQLHYRLVTVNFLLSKHESMHVFLSGYFILYRTEKPEFVVIGGMRVDVWH